MIEPWSLPEGWGWKKLSEVAPEDIQQIIPLNYPEQEFNYWGLESIEKNQVVEPQPNFVFGSSIQSACIKFNNQHVLYCKLRPYLNKVIVPSTSGIGSTEWVPLKPDPNILERKYLAYYLRSPQFLRYSTRNVAGARMPRISKKALKETLIPIPLLTDPPRSLAEQRRIVSRLEALLGEVKAMREQVQIMRRDVNRLMESALAEVFPSVGQPLPQGWEWKEIGRIVEIHDHKRIPIKEQDRIPGNIPYCGANGIIDYVNGFTHDGEFVLLAEDGGKFKAFEKSAYMMSGKFWANNHVHILRGRENLLVSKYLYYVLFGSDLTPYLTGTTRPKLTQSAMKRIKIPLPFSDAPAHSLAEQRRIVAYLDGIQAEVREAQKLIEEDLRAIEQLEQSILAAAFRGEL